MIIGKKLRLRAIELDDLPTLAKWRNDPQIYQHFYEHEPLSLAMQRRWFEKYLERSDEKLWLAETIVKPHPIGTVSLVHIDSRNRMAELGRVLIADSQLRGKGYGEEMCALALGYAFNHLNLHRVFLEVFAKNVKAADFYKRLGFVQEGVLRHRVYAEGKYCDVIVMSMLENEFRSHKS